jgi:hypothetical protein
MQTQIDRGELARHSQLGCRTSYGRAELQVVTLDDGEVEAEEIDLLRELLWIGRGGFKAQKRATFRRVR